MAGEISSGSVVQRSLTSLHLSTSANIERTQLVQKALATFSQPLMGLRVWDAFATLLPGTPASDDLGLVTGTFATGPPQVQTGDVKTLGATTRRARTIITLPDNYDAGEDVQIRCRAGMKTTVADTTATIDVEAYLINDDGTLNGSPTDLVATSATTINSLTYANKDFILDATNLVPGSRLDVRISIATNDAAGATAVIGVLHDLSLRCDVRP